MTTGSLAINDSALEEFQPYRPVSKAAVTALILGLLSGLALATQFLLVLPALGLIFGWVGVRTVRRFPSEFSGGAAALSGLLLNIAWLTGASAFHAVVYATEVPPGYQRISFADLQPSSQTPQLPVPPEALELDGQRVFVKGYLYPDGQRYDIKQFVMVPDMGTCCFGGQPKLTDMIEVTLRDPHRVEFARRKRKLGGILKVDTRLKPVSGLGGVYYQLDADYVK